MRSSAMRDMMAITARPDVISLAGGLPDTSTFPPQAFAAEMNRIAEGSVAEVLQYGPTEGLGLIREQIVNVMAAEGMRIEAMDVTVTTGGQQAIDLITKVLMFESTRVSFVALQEWLVKVSTQNGGCGELYFLFDLRTATIIVTRKKREPP